MCKSISCGARKADNTAGGGIHENTKKRKKIVEIITLYLAKIT